MIVTVAVVSLRLKGYDLVPKLAPKGLEIGTVVHVLCTRVGEPDIAGMEENRLP